MELRMELRNSTLEEKRKICTQNTAYSAIWGEGDQVLMCLVPIDVTILQSTE